jgi:DNA-binding SARP family transcriptional activator
MRIEVLGEPRIVEGEVSRPFPTGRAGQLLELLVLHAGDVVAAGGASGASTPEG